MRVLITGAAGLYGVHLVDELAQLDEVASIIGVDNFSRTFLVSDPFFPSRLREHKFKLIKKDYRELTTADFDNLAIDVVIHLAAYTSIDESMTIPENYFLNNEYGTFRLMQTLYQTKKQPLMIYASSPEVYGNPLYTPMDVDHPMYPRSVYAVTKLAAEKHCRAMHEWYGYPVVVFRNFNTYGENQNIGGYAAVIPNFIDRALAGQPLVIHNNGEQTRDFLYVRDAVRAYVLALLRGRELGGQTFNIGTGRQTSVNKLAAIVLALTGSTAPLYHEPGRSGDLLALAADISGTTARLGWQPQYSLEEGLKRVIAWQRRVSQ